MDYTCFQVEIVDAIAIVTFDRPPVNAQNFHRLDFDRHHRKGPAGIRLAPRLCWVPSDAADRRSLGY